MHAIAARTAPTPDGLSLEAVGDGLTFGAFRLPASWLEMPNRLQPLVIHENLPADVSPVTVFELVSGITSLVGARVIPGAEVGACASECRVAGDVRPAVRRFAAMEASLPGALFKDVDSLVLSFLLRLFWALEDEGHPPAALASSVALPVPDVLGDLGPEIEPGGDHGDVNPFETG